MVNEDLGNITRLQLDQMITTLESMPIGMPLVWLYVWDVIKNAYDIMSHDEGYTKANPNSNIDDVWNELWSNPVFTLEFGVEALDEDIRDWLMKHNFIIDIEDQDMLDSTEEEVENG